MSQWVFEGDLTKIYEEHEAYVAPNGTLYGSDFPKAEIQGGLVVNGPGAPSSVDFHVLSNSVEMVNGVPTRVYQTTPVTDAEKAQLAKDAHNSCVRTQMAALEATITSRRSREALFTEAGRTWLAGVDNQIAILRATLLP